MTRNRFIYSLLACLFLFTNAAYSGVSLGGTRVIYPSEKKQVALPVSTGLEKDAFLIQSWIEPENSIYNGLFTITPPLFMMKGKKDNQLRIMLKDDSLLPKDRESLFWVNVKSIPASDKADKDKNILQFSVTNKIKMFYRPADIEKFKDDAPSKLKLSLNGGYLIVNNPSQFHLNMIKVSFNNEKIDNLMISPFSEKKIAVKSSNNHKNEFTYSLINDYGATTEPVIKAIN